MRGTISTLWQERDSTWMRQKWRGIFVAGERMRQKCGVFLWRERDSVDEAEVAGFFCGGETRGRSAI